MTSACHAEDHGFESRTNRHFFGFIAQSVEQRTENPCVAGSIPAGATRKIDTSQKWLFFNATFAEEKVIVTNFLATNIIF